MRVGLGSEEEVQTFLQQVERWQATATEPVTMTVAPELAAALSAFLLKGAPGQAGEAGLARLFDLVLRGRGYRGPWYGVIWRAYQRAGWAEPGDPPPHIGAMMIAAPGDPEQI